MATRGKLYFKRALSALLACSVAAACGASAAAAATSSIAGTYQTAVTLTSSTCTGISVQNNPTTVAHVAGDASFTLTHAGQSYTGSLASNNTFTTAAKAIPVGSATHTLSIAGSFANSGFIADVTAVVTGGATCQYAVHWVGTK